MPTAFSRVLLPLDSTIDRSRVLLPATVMASWFDAAVQIVGHEGSEVEELGVLATSLGVAAEPVLVLDEPFTPCLAAHAEANNPSIVVTEPNARGLAIAAASSQPVFLVADGLGHRLPVGPFVVEIRGEADDFDAAALAALVSRPLGVPVRLVYGDDEPERDKRIAKAGETEIRLRQMDCEVGIDAIAGDVADPLAVVARTREATAAIVPASRLDEPGLIERATASGVSVLVAPRPRPDRGRPSASDGEGSTAPPPPGSTLHTLDRQECMARLERHSLARIGYVEAGWPTVVPINYRMSGGEVFIRSLIGSKLKSAARNDTVCLELDGYDEALRTGWSVVVHGRLEVIRDASVLSEAWANDPHPWVAADSWEWLRLQPLSVSGREVGPGSD